MSQFKNTKIFGTLAASLFIVAGCQRPGPQIYNPTISLTSVSGINPAPGSDFLLFNATVTHDVAQCNGNVTFTINNQAIGYCSAQTLVDGIASCNMIIPTIGSYSIVATYNGSPTCYTATSSTYTQDIDSNAT